MAKLVMSDGNGGLVIKKELLVLLTLVIILGTALATTAMTFGRMENRVDNLENINTDYRLDIVEKNGAVYEQIIKEIRADIKEIKDLLKGD